MPGHLIVPRFLGEFDKSVFLRYCLNSVMKIFRENIHVLIPLIIAVAVFLPLLSLFFLFFLAIILDPVLKRPPAAGARAPAFHPLNIPVIRGPPFCTIA